jgi:hypothetical protein
MIKVLSFTDVERFHKELADKMLTDLRDSDSKDLDINIESIQWAYSVETSDTALDVRKRSKDIDRTIRREKLLSLDGSLKPKKTVLSYFYSKTKSKNVINSELTGFCDKIATISLMIKVGDYERFETVDKTDIFESNVTEKRGIFSF